MPMTEQPRAVKACNSAQATWVLPTPVSVPVTKYPRAKISTLLDACKAVVCKAVVYNAAVYKSVVCKA